MATYFFIQILCGIMVFAMWLLLYKKAVKLNRKSLFDVARIIYWTTLLGVLFLSSAFVRLAEISPSEYFAGCGLYLLSSVIPMVIVKRNKSKED